MKEIVNITDVRSHGNVSRSILVKTWVKKAATPLPELNCSKSRNSMRLHVTDWSNDVVPTFDLRYAVKVNGKVYNANHSESIVGKEFTLGGHNFVVPHTSDYDIRVYVADADIPRSFIVQLIPSPDQEYNGIYGIGEYADERSYSYVDRNTDIFFCMTPEQAPVPITCVGATQVLSLLPSRVGYSDLTAYISIADTTSGYLNLAVDNSVVMDNGITGHVEIGDTGNILITLTRDDDVIVDYKIMLSYHTNGDDSDVTLAVDTSANPTAVYDSYYESIGACIKTKETPIVQLTCDGATNVLSYSLQQPMDGYNLNHTTLVYNINIDGVDYGEHDLTRGSVNLDHITLDNYIDSGGAGTLYTSTRDGNEPPARFVFTPREDMVDANFWGINEESNPTAIYNSVNRSIQVCMTFSANT